MIQEQQKYFFPLQVMLDFLSGLLVYLVSAPLALYIQAGNSAAADVGFSLPGAWQHYLNIAPLAVLLPLLFLHLTKSYSHTGIKQLRWIIYSTGNAAIISACFLLSVQILYPGAPVGRSFLWVFFPLTWLLFVANRLLIVRLILQARRNSNLRRHMLIIGTDHQAASTAALFRKHRDWGTVVAGFIAGEDDLSLPHPEASPVIGTIDELPDILTSRIVDCVLLISGVSDVSTIRRISILCEAVGIDFGFSASAFSEKSSRVTAESIEQLSAVYLQAFTHAPEKLFFKRLFDVLMSAALIVLFIPFWIAVPWWIKRTSPGPVLYGQERVGKHGRLFTMYKFRTMVMDADKMIDRLAHLNEMDGPVFKIKDDPRFTPIGKFLRQSSIDELPQLFNVLRGDMSLIGPRPPIMKEVRQYTLWQKKRLSVVPGITCLWQVTGRNEIRFEEWMQLDLQYIENWSLTLDLKILIQTITAVISRRGAS